MDTKRRRISKTSHWGPCFAIFTIHESTRPGVTALIAAFSTSQPLERLAKKRELVDAKNRERGLSALSRPLQRAVDRWWNTYQLLVAHQKPLRSIFHVALSSAVSRLVDNQDGSRIFLNFIYRLQNSFRFENSNYLKVNLRDRFIEYLSSFEISLEDFPF